MRTPRPTLDVYEHRLVLQGGNGAAFERELAAGYGDDEAVGAAVASLFQEIGNRRGATSVEVRIHPPLGQVRTLRDLPPVPARDLGALVANQRTRFFRRSVGETVTAAEWAGSRERTCARAALADRELLERLERSLEHVGRRVDRFASVDAAGEQGPALLTPRTRRRMRRRTLGTMIAAASLALFGWSAAGATYVLDLRNDGRAIERELESLDSTLSRIDDLSSRLVAFAPIANAVRRQSADQAWVLGQFAVVATALPPDAHLHGFRAEREGGVTIDVHGPDALDVVEALSVRWPGAARLDGPPEPDAADPAARDGARRLERFTVRVSVSASRQPPEQGR